MRIILTLLYFVSWTVFVYSSHWLNMQLETRYWASRRPYWGVFKRSYYSAKRAYYR
jgi:hypothetical protein